MQKNKTKFKKLSKVGRSTSKSHKTIDANSRVLADEGLEDKGLGDLGIKASLSLQEIHLTDGDSSRKAIFMSLSHSSQPEYTHDLSSIHT